MPCPFPSSASRFCGRNSSGSCGWRGRKGESAASKRPASEAAAAGAADPGARRPPGRGGVLGVDPRPDSQPRRRPGRDQGSLARTVMERRGGFPLGPEPRACLRASSFSGTRAPKRQPAGAGSVRPSPRHRHQPGAPLLPVPRDRPERPERRRPGSRACVASVRLPLAVRNAHDSSSIFNEPVFVLSAPPVGLSIFAVN